MGVVPNLNKITLYKQEYLGRAQLIKMCCQHLEIDYEEVILTEDMQVPDRMLLYRQGDNPYITDGDHTVTDCDAIMHYLCYKTKHQELLGRTPQEKIKLAEMRVYLYNLYEITLEHVIRTSWETDKVQFESYVEGELRKLEKYKGKNDFLCGGITYIDLMAFYLLGIFELMFEERISCKCPRLRIYSKRMASLPCVQRYKSSALYKARPLYPPNANWR